MTSYLENLALEGLYHKDSQKTRPTDIVRSLTLKLIDHDPDSKEDHV